MSNILPTVDIVFKKLFGVEENKDLLESLINSVVSEEDQVKEIQILNPYNISEFKDAKSSILDVKAKSESGKRFNVEIQLLDEIYYQARALYYWSQLYAGSMKKGAFYNTLTKSIGIHILNYDLVSPSDSYHNIFVMKEKHKNFEFFNNIEIHTIELNKFTEGTTEELPDIIAKVKTKLDAWTAFLSRCDLLDKKSLPSEVNLPEIKRALEVVEVMGLSEDEYSFYTARMDKIRMDDNVLKKAELNGEQRGLLEGIEKGIEKGEKKAKYNTAKNLKEIGLSSEQIAQATGLTMQEVEKL